MPISCKMFKFGTKARNYRIYYVICIFFFSLYYRISNFQPLNSNSKLINLSIFLPRFIIFFHFIGILLFYCTSFFCFSIVFSLINTTLAVHLFFMPLFYNFYHLLLNSFCCISNVYAF